MENRYKVLIDTDMFIKMINNKDIFECLCCGEYKTTSDLWDYSIESEYKYKGLCCDCQEKIVNGK